MIGRRHFLKGMFGALVAVPAVALGSEAHRSVETPVTQPEAEPFEIPASISYEEDWQIQSVEITPSTIVSKSLMPNRQVADLIITDLYGKIVAVGKPPHRLGGYFQFQHMGSDWVMDIHTGSENRDETNHIITLTGPVRCAGEPSL